MVSIFILNGQFFYYQGHATAITATNVIVNRKIYVYSDCCPEASPSACIYFLLGGQVVQVMSRGMGVVSTEIAWVMPSIIRHVFHDVMHMHCDNFTSCRLLGLIWTG